MKTLKKFLENFLKTDAVQIFRTVFKIFNNLSMKIFIVKFKSKNFLKMFEKVLKK